MGLAGELAYQRFALTQEEMDFLAGMRFDGELIDRVCGLPSGYWDAKANRANAEQAERSLAADTITPILTHFGNVIDSRIFEVYYEESGGPLTAAFENVIPEDRQLQVMEFDRYSRAMSYDEARARIGLPSVEGELGSTPFALLQFLGQMVATGLAPMPEIEAKAFGSNGHNDNGAVKDELRNWLKVALKETARGEDPSARPFFSDLIPAHVRGLVEERLAGAVGEEEVRFAFEWALENAG